MNIGNPTQFTRIYLDGMIVQIKYPQAKDNGHLTNQGEHAKMAVDCLTEKEGIVLEVLAVHEGEFLDQVTIAAKAGLTRKASRGSVRPHLHSLKEMGLIYWPPKTQGRIQITPKGLDYCRRYRTSRLSGFGNTSEPKCLSSI
jgi:hypothetical protein